MRTIAQKYQEEGLEIGLQKGIEQGVERGVEKVAQNMLFNLHLDLEIVQKATGLSRQVLEKMVGPRRKTEYNM